MIEKIRNWYLERERKKYLDWSPILELKRRGIKVIFK